MIRKVNMSASVDVSRSLWRWLGTIFCFCLQILGCGSPVVPPRCHSSTLISSSPVDSKTLRGPVRCFYFYYFLPSALLFSFRQLDCSASNLLFVMLPLSPTLCCLPLHLRLFALHVSFLRLSHIRRLLPFILVEVVFVPFCLAVSLRYPLCL